ncbi:MAG: ABC transporter permease [Saprospiraceae bacterium]|nr:ABC transporter permease [Saprospiraceae bacterium]
MAAHLKIILRSMARNKVYAAINILGLAVGVAAVLLIYRIVSYELSFNKQFANYDRIVRIVRHDNTPEGTSWTTCVPIPAGQAIRQSVPQFEAFSPAREAWPTIAVIGQGGIPEKKIPQPEGMISFFAEPSFVKIFNFDWLAGNPATALKEVGAVVLTKQLAEQCFGSAEAAMNQSVVLDNTLTCMVRGVIADMPTNTDLPIFSLISYATLIANPDNYYTPYSWGECSSNSQAFALLKDPAQWEDASAVLSKIGEKEYAEEAGKNKVEKVHQLQALSDLHYNEELYNPAGRIITKNRLKVLGFIGILVLAMACFNFINLSTAQATQRSREVGVRKTLGMSRAQLVRMFMAETATVTGIAVLLGLALATLCLPLLRFISDVPPVSPFLSLPQTWGFLGATLVVVTLLAGFYPSLVLAGFDPAGALKSQSQVRVKGSIGQGFVRQGLVVIQFSIAAALIVGALVTLGQLDFIRNKDLGFDKNLVYTLEFNNDSLSLTKMEPFKQLLLQNPSVEGVSFCSDHPASGNTWNTNFAYPASAEDADFNLSLKFADADYQKAYGLRLKAGNWYEPSDTIRQAVVNETLLKKLGITDPYSVVGTQIRLGGGRSITISGVVEDFHSHSVHQPMEPMLITSRKIFYGRAGVKIQPGNLAVTTAAIQKTFDEVFPEQAFYGEYLDENIAQFYTDEDRFSNTCKGFGLLAVFIACLGLFGLSMHNAARRTKEIGVRKVLGAGVAELTGLLAKDFLKLVIVSLAIAFPLAYWLMEKWLADFAFRIDLSWGIFAVSGILAMLVAFLTVSFQSVKAALADPVKSLKNE